MSLSTTNQLSRNVYHPDQMTGQDAAEGAWNQGERFRNQSLVAHRSTDRSKYRTCVFWPPAKIIVIDYTVFHSAIVAPSNHAVFCTFNPSSSIVRSRMMNFWIFPVTVIGNSSTNLI
jgi:hypothetical protein